MLWLDMNDCILWLLVKQSDFDLVQLLDVKMIRKKSIITLAIVSLSF